MPDKGRRLVIGVLIHDFALGGSERSAIRLANAWAALGHTVILLVGDPEGPLASLVSADVTVRSPDNAIVKRTGQVRTLGKWAGQAAREARCDILFVPGNWHFRAIPPLRRMLAPHTAIVAKLSNLVGRRNRGGIAALVRLWSMRRRLAHADRVVAMSEGLARDAAAVVAPSRLSVIVSPVLDGPPAPPAEVGSDLVAIGRLVPQKNLALAVQAFAKLDRPGLHLVIAGDGPERAALGALAAKLNIAERTNFIGRVESADVVLKDARLLLLPSSYEGYPSVAVEALAMGVPVVATDSSPAMTEIISHPEAGTISAADPEAFARAIGDMLDRPAPDRRKLAGLVAHHQLSAVAQDYLSLFRTLAR